jgi:hypothetical protein
MINAKRCIDISSDIESSIIPVHHRNISAYRQAVFLTRKSHSMENIYQGKWIYTSWICFANVFSSQLFICIIWRKYQIWKINIFYNFQNTSRNIRLLKNVTETYNVYDIGNIDMNSWYRELLCLSSFIDLCTDLFAYCYTFVILRTSIEIWY